MQLITSNIIILLIIVILLIFFYKSNKKETFDLGPKMFHFPWQGRFNDAFLIGVAHRFGGKKINLRRCKNLCNITDSCHGISYRKPTNEKNKKHRECRLYNQATHMIRDPNYISWRNFYDSIY